MEVWTDIKKWKNWGQIGALSEKVKNLGNVCPNKSINISILALQKRSKTGNMVTEPQRYGK